MGTNAAFQRRIAMRSKIYIALAVGCGLTMTVGARAQSKPAPVQKPPAQQQPPQKPPADANPFPEDTTSVPVVPTTAEPAPVPATPPASEGAATTGLLKNDTDPVHSPDDPATDGSNAEGFSSSLAGTGDVNIPDEERRDKHGRVQQQPAVHQETAKEDESVGEFELNRKNWRAALSRYQSALVNDPENPDVYWGIAEAQRGLGNYAEAKANYQKVVDYDDPESKHSKEAKKLLKSAQLANAPAVSANEGQRH
jgi:tetratricopeptide (TPR) repeat protein